MEVIIQPQTENENVSVMLDILRAFVECKLENQTDELEIQMLGKFVEAIESGKECNEFLKETSEEYFYINYQDPVEADKRYKEFLSFSRLV